MVKWLIFKGNCIVRILRQISDLVYVVGVYVFGFRGNPIFMITDNFNIKIIKIYFLVCS